MATANEISNNEHNHFAWRTALPNAVSPDKVINFQTRVRNLEETMTTIACANGRRRLSRAPRQPMHRNRIKSECSEQRRAVRPPPTDCTLLCNLRIDISAIVAPHASSQSDVVVYL